MSNKRAFKTIRQFLFPEREKEFVIPNYQRGYKWAVKENGYSAVEKLCDDLINANKEQKYFLQGVTVTEENNKVILIDGQQRTTTLYMILWYLRELNDLKLTYDIRQSSKEFIHNLKNQEIKTFNTSDEDSQDVYYFKKAIEQIDEKLKEKQSVEFTNFLLDKVTILYIVIAPDKATKTFTMMNGSKATMLQEELVKAEMLRKVSLPDKIDKTISTSVDENLAELKEIIAIDWETNAIRSRYAREWDKWLYWWNRKDVQKFFGTKNPLGHLLKFHIKKNKEKNTDKVGNKKLFDVFRESLYENGENEKQMTKLIFKELRDLQKSFEDIFTIPKVHNYLKMSLICYSDNDDKFDVIKYFIDQKSNIEALSDYAKWSLVGATHLEITDPEKSSSGKTKESRALEALENLSKPLLYYDTDAKPLAFKQLLRLNVEEDNKFNRKFDFNIWGSKSLEHIHPKSKVYHKVEFTQEDGIVKQLFKNGNGEDLGEVEPTGTEWLNRDVMDENCSEHCIGNLVLLYGSNNSTFGAKSFAQKKDTYFNIDPKTPFESRHLLHTISVFSKTKWDNDEIRDERKKFILRFKKDYGVM